MVEEKAEALNTGGDVENGQDTPPAEDSVNWQAEAQALKEQISAKEAQIAKLENDARSSRIGTMKAQERDALIRELKSDVGVWKDTNRALIEAITSGDTESLPQKLQGIEQQGEQARAASSFESYHSTMLSNLGGYAEGFGIDIQNDPAFQGLRGQWNEAQRSGNYTGIADVYGTFQQTIRQEYDQRQEVASKEAEMARKQQRQQERREEGDLDTGPTAPVPGPRDHREVLATRVADVPFSDLEKQKLEVQAAAKKRLAELTGTS